MTNEHLTSNQPTTNPWDGDNVIAVSFEDDHEAYHALSLFKELDSQQPDGRPGGRRRRPRRGRAASREGRDPVGVPGQDSEWRPHRPVARDHRRTLRRADRRRRRAEARLAIRPGRLRGHRLGAGRDLKLGPGRSHRAVRRRRGAEPRGRRYGHVPESAARYCGAPWTRSRPRPQSQRRPSTKPNANARKELLRSHHGHNKAAVNTKIEELKAKVHHGQRPSPVSA